MKRRTFCIIVGGALLAPSPITLLQAARRTPEPQPIPAARLYTLEDRVVAAVIIGEAGGEGIKGMQAVMHVIDNRAKMRRKTHHQIVTAPKQFLCLNRENLIEYVAEKTAHPRYTEALTLAFNFQNASYLPDITGGATHYHVYKGSSKVSPYWTAISLGGKNKKARITTKIGAHIFLKNVD